MNKEKIKSLWIKYKEYILYLIVGGITMVINYAVYFVCAHPFSLGTIASNTISWVFAVAAAYILNKIWVFEYKSKDKKDLAREIIEFTLARVFTLVVETVLLWLTVDIAGWNDLIMKIVVSVITIVLNYIFSKFIIFKKPKNEPDNSEK